MLNQPIWHNIKSSWHYILLAIVTQLTQRWWIRPLWSRLVLRRSRGSRLCAAREKTETQETDGDVPKVVELLQGFSDSRTNPFNWVFVVCLNVKLQSGKLLLLPLLRLFHWRRRSCCRHRHATQPVFNTETVLHFFAFKTRQITWSSTRYPQREDSSSF